MPYDRSELRVFPEALSTATLDGLTRYADSPSFDAE